MSPVSAVLFAWLLAQATEPSPPANPAEPTAPAAPTPEPPEPIGPPPLPPPPEPQAYGYRGMSELSVALGYSSSSGFLGEAGYRRFIVAGLAPGAEASIQTGAGMTIGLVLGTLRVVPFRARQFAFVLTGRAGRVLLSQHDDGWGAGGGAGVIISLAENLGLELGYDVLWLLPRSFCADLSSCALQGPEIGLRLAF